MGPPRLQPPQLDRTMSFVRRQFHYRKPITPFISSTFQDFQDEREILVKKVFPSIDALCRERGTYCTPVDLRWGINDSQVNSGLVIQLCLDYITRCAPFFICLLGERYGSHRPNEAAPLPNTFASLPSDAHWLDKNFVIAASAGYDWILQDTYQHCSITELETIQAAFLGEEGNFCHFYFRQPEHVDYLFTDLPEEERLQKLKLYETESEFSDLKVRDLKARIVKKGLPVKYFKTPDELARLVLEDYTEIVNVLYPPLEEIISQKYSDRFAEWMAHETFAETRRRIFVKTPEIDELFTELTDFALSSLEEPPVEKGGGLLVDDFSFSKQFRKKGKPEPAKYISINVLVGDRGCGKTSVLANWVKQFKEEHRDFKLFSHYVGSSSTSTDITAMMHRCTRERREEYQHVDNSDCHSDVTTATEEASDFNHVCESFLASVGLGPCVLVVDGIDELGGTYAQTAQQIKELLWLPNILPAQCKIIFTSVRSDVTFKSLSQRQDTKVLTVPLLANTASKKEVIREHLAMHCKSLSNEQLERIVNCKLSNRALFLSVLANELRVFGVYSHLDYHLDSYLEAASIRDLWGRIIKRWIKDYGWTTNAVSLEGSESDRSVEYTGWVADALRLIAVSRQGLSQSEILNMLNDIGYRDNSEVTSFDWALFRSAVLDSLFERPGGLLNFFHQHFREAVEYTLLGSATPESTLDSKFHNSIGTLSTENDTNACQPNRKTYHGHISNYFYKQPKCKRRLEELPWQLERAGDYKRLCEVVSEPSLLTVMVGDKQTSSKRIDLLHYWKILSNYGYTPGATYKRMLRRASGEPLEDLDVPFELGDSDNPDGSRGVSVLSQERPATPVPPTPVVTPVVTPLIYTTPPSDSDSSSAEDEEISKLEKGQKGLEEDSMSERSVYTTDAESLSGEEGRYSQTDLARLGNHVGMLLSILGDFNEAEEILLQALDRLKDSYPLEIEELKLVCTIKESLGNLYKFQLRKPEAFDWYRKALTSLQELLDDLLDAEDERFFTESKGRLLDHVGNMKTLDRDLELAERMLSKARQCMEESGSLSGSATVQYHIGILRMYQGHFEEAESCFQESVSSLERWYGRSHPRVADVLNDLAGLLCNPDNNVNANKVHGEALYRRSLQIREQSFGPDHILVATTLFHLAKLLKQKRSRPAKSEALRLLRRALDIRTTKLGTDHFLTAAVRKHLSQLEMSMSYKPNRPPDKRTDEQPHSSLSWHDRDLARKSAKASRSQNRTTSRSPSKEISALSKLSLEDQQGCKDPRTNGNPFSPLGHTKTESVVLDDNDNEKVVNGDIERRPVAPGVIQLHPGVSDCGDTDRDNVSSDSSERYLDSFANDTLQDLPRFHKSVRVREPNRPHTAPYRLYKKYGSVHSRANSASTGDDDHHHHHHHHHHHGGFHHKKRHSAPPGRAPRFNQSGSATHRKTCYIPGPHTIDVHNAYSVNPGPHSDVKSLLGPPPCPREPRGIQHASAWYHVPGRYPTPENPLPPKRQQKRLEPSRESSQW